MFDFNKVKVIGVTTPVVQDIPDSEGIVSYAARVSSPQNQDNFETASRLLKYCLKHQHYSVFETVNILMEVETPRDIARQLLRHRSFTFQELSQRYSEVGKFVYRDARLQDNKNRQNSIETVDLALKAEWNKKQAAVLVAVEDAYKWAIENGIAKECARVILPEGLTMSKLYVNGTLRSWLHYAKLREKNGTQLEHADIALKVMAKDTIFKHFPFLEEIWDEI